METLLTGHIDVVSQSFLTHLSMKSDVVISSEKESLHFSGKKITPYYQSILDDDFLNLFSSYSFDAVIFFLSTPERSDPDPYELEKLERVLEACAQRSIKKMIVVSSAYVNKVTENENHKHFKHATIRLFSMEELCRTYRETYHVPIMILQTSCLFGEDETSSYVGKSIKQLVEKEDIVLDGKPDQMVEFLSITDLGRLIERILLESQKNITTMNVPGGVALSLSQFAELLERNKETVTVRFTGKELAASPPLDSYLASEEYYWEPTIKLDEEMESIVKTIEQKNKVKTKSLWERTRGFYQSHSSLLAGLELVIGFFLMEYLVAFSQTTVQFRVVDFRLMFVVLFAGAHGPQIGLAAALMASFSTYTSFTAMGVDWRIIFYDVDNWIPFAVYFIVAWIIGYIRDRYKMDLADAREDNEMLSNRYALLNDLYLRSLERKSSYEKQIISYSDSFGKLYQFTKRLEYAEASHYLIEALDAVEEMLDNQSVSIYLLKENASSAHRYVCSAKAAYVSPELFNLNEYPELKKTLTNGGVWANKKQFEGYPDYAVRIYATNKFSVLMTIHAASFDQMSLYYENLIKVTGHFVSTSLDHKMNTQGEAITTVLTDFLKETSDVRKSSRYSKENKVEPVEEVPLRVIQPDRKFRND